VYSKKVGNDNLKCIPDYWFINWRENGIVSYDEWICQILQSAEKPPEFNKVFWIGSISNNAIRKKMYDLGKTDDRMEIIASDIPNEKGEKPYISLLDHTKYKYLIDVEGIAWSSRRKMLMFMKRPLLFIEDDWEEFWTKDIEPYVHYIPVKRDLSDLIEKIDWLENNWDMAEKIAINAQEYAKSHLMPENAIQYFEKIILDEGKK
jgi:hypothetical protein